MPFDRREHVVSEGFNVIKAPVVIPKRDVMTLCVGHPTSPTIAAVFKMAVPKRFVPRK